MFNQFRYLIRDLERWKVRTFKDLFYVCFETGVWATVLYRISRALFVIELPVIKIFLRLIGYLVYKFAEIFLGVAISPGANIGPGLYVGHAGCIRVVPEAIAGQNLSIGTGVFIARKGLG